MDIGQIPNYIDGFVAVGLSVYIIKLLNNHLSHRLSRMEEKIDKLQAVVDRFFQEKNHRG
jgi:hypothetical protein